MTTRDLAHVALFAALTAALGVLPALAVPFVPVPVTAQTLGPMLAGAVLGARRAGLSQLVFVVLVAAGLPLLAGGRGGLAVFAGPSGGFVLAFPLGALVVGLLTERFWDAFTLPRALLATTTGGIVAVYAVGVPYLALLGDLPLWQAAAGALVFVPGDLAKAAVAAAAAVGVRRAYPVLERR